MSDTLILGIETSCDDTAAAVVKGGYHVLSDVLRSQDDIHTPFGGIVPEFASRAHIAQVEPVVHAALDQAGIQLSDLDAVAVTQGPGLIGSLLVGVSFAKALAYTANIPLIGVHHLEGHLASVWLDSPDVPVPHIALVVSGGHTNLYLVPSRGKYQLLGQTLDDAAGEAFDKAAKMLGLGYPGGPIIDQLAQSGDPRNAPFSLPYASKQSFDFSFSGIKTALRYFLQSAATRRDTVSDADIAAGYQTAIVTVLVQKTIHAATCYDIRDIIMVGGVAANSSLRHNMRTAAAKEGIRLHHPHPRHCTDNGAMIAAAGWTAYAEKQFAALDVEPFAQGAIGTRDAGTVPTPTEQRQVRGEPAFHPSTAT